MDDEHALLWEKSRRKRDFNEHDEGGSGLEAKKAKALSDYSTSTKEADESTSERKDEASSSAQKESGNIEVTKAELKNDVDNEKQFSNEDLHEKLKSIDPNMAARLHPNNRRKVLR